MGESDGMERLELVRDFGELRCGMIVVVKPCECCGSNCRAMLLSLDGDEWTVTPPCHGATGRDYYIIAAEIIPLRIVFRVVDDEVTQVSTAVTRKRTKEKCE